MWVTHGTRHLWKDGSGQVIASIVTDPSGKAFAQVIGGDGKAIREEHADIARSQNWCELIMGVAPPARPAVAPPRASSDQVIRKLVTVLMRDPNLAWEVVRQVPVLGPWTPDGEAWERLSSTGTCLAIVNRVPSGWRWHHLNASATPIDGKIGFASDQEARDACDEHFKKAGWVLAG